MSLNYNISSKLSTPFPKILELININRGTSERSELRSAEGALAEGLYLNSIAEGDIASEASVVGFQTSRPMILEKYNAVLSVDFGPQTFSPLEAQRAKGELFSKSAKPIGPRFRESEGRSPAVLLEEEQVAVSDQNFDVKKYLASEVKIPKNKSFSLEACRDKKWSIVFAKKDKPDSLNFARFRCKSWRCPYCTAWVRKKDYSRMQRAFKRNPGQYIFAVLTFDQKKIQKKNAYESISKKSNALIKRIERTYGSIMGVQAVEQHRSGYPHVNFVFKFNEIEKVDKAFINKFLKRFLIPNAVKTGFGKQATADLLIDEDVEKVLSYVSKTGLTVISGEINKVSQVPIDAPKGFRRLRSIRGFLKEPKIQSELTGGIVKSRLEDIKLASDKIGYKGLIELVSREFPKLSDAKTVYIFSSDTERLTNFFTYKFKTPDKSESYPEAC